MPRGKADRKNAESLPVFSEADLYEDSPVGLCVLDAGLRFLRVNRRFCEWTGKPASHFVGKKMQELWPASVAQTRKLFRQLVRTGEPIRDIPYLRDTHTTPGVERSWLGQWQPIKDARGRVVAVNVAFTESSARLAEEEERRWMIAELDRERRHLTTIMEQLPAGVIIVEAPSGRSVFGNKESAHIFRHPFRPAQSVPDYAAWKLFKIDGSPLPPQEYPLARAVLTGETVKDERLMIERGDGTRGMISANAAPIHDRKRQPIAAVVTFFDITELHRTVEALRESEAKFRRIAENSPFGLGTYDASGRITFMNPRLIAMIGYRLRDMPRLEMWFRRAYPDPVYRREVETTWASDIARVQSGELPYSPVREYRITCRDGSVKELEITFALGDGFTYAIFNDVTVRKVAERETQRLTQHLEQLVAERTEALGRVNAELRQEITERLKLQCDLISVAEREQRRLGEALHDELGQQLAGIGLMAAILERDLREEGHPKAPRIAQLGDLLRRAVGATRDMAKGFYPMVLEDGRLVLALRDLATSMQAISGVACTVRHQPSFRFKEDAAIHLYRIAQEAVNNALRHGAPKSIAIELQARRGVSTLTVINDGRSYVAKPGGTGLGLQFVRHRAELIGAKVRIARGARGGCEVVCTLPKPG